LSDSEILSIQAELLKAKDQLQQQEKKLMEVSDSLMKKERELAAQKEQIEWFQKMLFGPKKETFIQAPEGQLSLPFDVDTQMVEQVLQEKQDRQAKEKAESERKPRKKHVGRVPLPKHLKVVEIILEPEGDLTDMVKVGEEITEVLEMKPAEYWINRFVRPKYAPKSSEGAFKIAELPKRIIDKSMFGDSLIVQFIIDKFSDHLPIYRQRQRLARQDIELKETTIHYVVQKAISKLEILYEYIWQTTMQKGYIQADETTIRILESPEKKSSHLGYFWVYNDPIERVPIFKYEPGRSKTFPTKHLQSFKGFLQTDGYPGYTSTAKRKDIIHAGCWSHVRRKFVEALSNYKSMAEQALIMIQALYEIEREAKDKNLAADQIKELRLEKSLPIVNAFFKWVAQNKSKVLPSSSIGKAIEFAYNQYKSMMSYLYNGNLKIDNNEIENSIRPIAIGRKNYLFCKNDLTAQRAAMVYTFLAICKNHKVNPADWLLHVLTKIDDTSIQQLHTLLPQNYIKQDGVA